MLITGKHASLYNGDVQSLATTRSLTLEPLLLVFALKHLESLARNENWIMVSTTSFFGDKVKLYQQHVNKLERLIGAKEPTIP